MTVWDGLRLWLLFSLRTACAVDECSPFLEGTETKGGCWFLGARGQSCLDVCGSRTNPHTVDNTLTAYMGAAAVEVFVNGTSKIPATRLRECLDLLSTLRGGCGSKCSIFTQQLTCAPRPSCTAAYTTGLGCTLDDTPIYSDSNSCDSRGQSCAFMFGVDPNEYDPGAKQADVQRACACKPGRPTVTPTLPPTPRPTSAGCMVTMIPPVPEFANEVDCTGLVGDVSHGTECKRECQMDRRPIFYACRDGVWTVDDDQCLPSSCDMDASSAPNYSVDMDCAGRVLAGDSSELCQRQCVFEIKTINLRCSNGVVIFDGPCRAPASCSGYSLPSFSTNIDCVSPMPHGQSCEARCIYEQSTSPQLSCYNGQISASPSVCPGPASCDVDSSHLPDNASAGDCVLPSSFSSGQQCTAQCLYDGARPMLSCTNGVVDVTESCAAPGTCAFSMAAYAFSSTCSIGAVAHGISCSTRCRFGTQLLYTELCDNGGWVSSDKQPCPAPRTCANTVPPYSSTSCAGNVLIHGNSCTITCSYGPATSYATQCQDGSWVSANTNACPAPASCNVQPITDVSFLNCPATLSGGGSGCDVRCDSTSEALRLTCVDGTISLSGTCPNKCRDQRATSVPGQSVTVQCGNSMLGTVTLQCPATGHPFNTVAVNCRRACPIDCTAANTCWPETVEFSTAMLPCGVEQTGSIRRTCLSSNNWSAPDRSGCAPVTLSPTSSATLQPSTSPTAHPTLAPTPTLVATNAPTMTRVETLSPTVTATAADTIPPTRLTTTTPTATPLTFLSVAVSGSNAIGIKERLFLQLSISYSGAVSELFVVWSEMRHGLDLESSPFLRSALDLPILVLAEGFSAPGTDYLFQASVTAPGGLQRVVTWSVRIKAGPQVQLSVSLQSANSLAQSFLASATATPAASYFYWFKYVDQSTGDATEINLSDRTPQSSVDLVLVPGTYDVVVYVDDGLGAVTRATYPLSIQALTLQPTTMPTGSFPGTSAPVPCTADQDLSGLLSSALATDLSTDPPRVDSTLQVVLLGARRANEGMLCGRESSLRLSMFDAVASVWNVSVPHSLPQAEQLGQALVSLTTGHEDMKAVQTLLVSNLVDSVFAAAAQARDNGDPSLGIQFSATIGQVLSNLLSVKYDQNGEEFCSVVLRVKASLERLFESDMGPLLAGENPVWLASENIVGAGARFDPASGTNMQLGDDADGLSFSIPAAALNSSDAVSITVVSVDESITQCYVSDDGTRADGPITDVDLGGATIGSDFSIVFPLFYDNTPKSTSDPCSVDVVDDVLQCRWWNTTHWLQDGCVALNVTDAVVWCRCTHLTEFAVIRQLRQWQRDSSELSECRDVPPPQLVGQTLYLVFCIIYTVVFVLASVQLVRLLRATKTKFGMVLGQHVLVLAISSLRIVYTALFYKQFEVDWELLVVFSMLPFCVLYWTFTLVIMTWAGIYHFAMNANGHSFGRVRKLFVAINVIITSAVLAIVVLFLVREGDQLRRIEQAGNIMLATVAASTSVGFVVYGSLLVRKIRRIDSEVKSTTRSRTKASVRKLFRTASAMSIIFFCEAAVLLVISGSSDFYIEHHDPLQGALLTLDVLSLATVLLLFSSMVARSQQTRATYPTSPTNASRADLDDDSFHSRDSTITRPPAGSDSTQHVFFADFQSPSRDSMDGMMVAGSLPPQHVLHDTVASDRDRDILIKELQRQRDGANFSKQGFGSEAAILRSEIERQRKNLDVHGMNNESSILQAEINLQRHMNSTPKDPHYPVMPAAMGFGQESELQPLSRTVHVSPPSPPPPPPPPPPPGPPPF